MPNPPNRSLIYIDVLTHHRLKRLALSYDTTIIELIRELVETEWMKKKGLERQPKEVKKDG
jgi:hypothetical protein